MDVRVCELCCECELAHLGPKWLQVNDLASLSELDEKKLITSLRLRYEADKIYVRRLPP
jgi:myosin heavy subunit